MNNSTMTPPKPKKTFKTSVSFPKDLHRAALKKCNADRRAFSTYLQILVERDLVKG